MLSSPDDPTVVKGNRFVEIGIEYGQVGNYLVEFLTWMKYVPSSLASWKKLADERHEEYNNFFVGMFREIEDRIVMAFILGSLPPCPPM